jgi:hypothetical protein
MNCLTRPANILIASLAFCQLVLAQQALAQQALSGNSLVLKGATVLDVLTGRSVPEAVIVIEGDKIKVFGDNKTPYPSNATVLDLSGKFVIPGLVDSHTHYRPWLGELYLNHGVTTAIGLGVRAALGEQYWQASQRSDVRTPRLYGTGKTRLPLEPSMTREQVRVAVDDYLKGEPDVANIRDYVDGNKQVWQWEVEDLHAAGLAVFGHTNNAPASIAIGHDVIEHPWGFAQALMTPLEYEDYRKGNYLHWGSFFRPSDTMDKMIRDAVRRNVYLNPTMVYGLSSLSSVADKYEQLIYNTYKDGALMSYYPQNLAGGLLLRIRSVWDYSARYGNYVQLSRLAAKDREELNEAYRLTGDFVKRWAQAGGKIAAGTDDPQVGTGGLSAHMEMAMLVEAGLTPLQALQSMSIWGAEIMTLKRKTPTRPPVGFIGEGALADLVVLGADPLANIDNTRRIERVMKGGAFVKLGYTPYYSQSQPTEIKTVPSIPQPEISALTPHTVVEGNSEVEMVVDGVGFMFDSVIRVNDVSVPTTFVSTRKLIARIPGNFVSSASPNRFREPGPDQYAGTYGDRTVKITVFNHAPDGGTSNSVSLRVQERWVYGQRE